MSEEMKWLELFGCICCERQVSRPGQLKCGLCAASPKALERTVAFHAPYIPAWNRLWRYLPEWQKAARTYAYSRAMIHQARFFAAARALQAQKGPITAETLDREISRRETGCARMAAHRITPEAIREARQGIAALRAMREALYGGTKGGGEG